MDNTVLQLNLANLATTLATISGVAHVYQANASIDSRPDFIIIEIGDERVIETTNTMRMIMPLNIIAVFSPPTSYNGTTRATWYLGELKSKIINNRFNNNGSTNLALDMRYLGAFAPEPESEDIAPGLFRIETQWELEYRHAMLSPTTLM